MKIRRIAVTLLTVLCAGCSSNPGVVQLTPDTYMLSKTSAAGAFANGAKMQAQVLQEASAYAQRQGKVAVPISGPTLNRPAVGFPTCDLTFAMLTQEEYARQKRSKVRDWNALTPAQRAEYGLREQEIQQKDRVVASAERQTAGEAFNRAMDRNSYDRRTHAMEQPLDVNVNGTLNHNIQGDLRHRVRGNIGVYGQ